MLLPGQVQSCHWPGCVPLVQMGNVGREDNAGWQWDLHRALGLSGRALAPAPATGVIPPGYPLCPLPTSVPGSHGAGGHGLPVPVTATCDLPPQRDPDSEWCLVNLFKKKKPTAVINPVIPYGLLPARSACRLCPRDPLSDRFCSGIPVFILERKTLQLREVKQLSQGCTVQGGNRGVKPSSVCLQGLLYPPGPQARVVGSLHSWGRLPCSLHARRSIRERHLRG